MPALRANPVPPLDAWLPDPLVRTRHRRVAHTDQDELWASATALRLCDTRTLGRLVRWRLPGTPPEMTFRELLSSYPFTLLDETAHYSVSGMCGRIWTVRKDYGRLRGPEDFRAWNEPGTVRVLISTWVQPLSDGRAELCGEARVAPVDRRAALSLRVLWAGIGRFESLIGSEASAGAVRRAQARSAQR